MDLSHSGLILAPVFIACALLLCVFASLRVTRRTSPTTLDRHWESAEEIDVVHLDDAAAPEHSRVAA